MKNSPLWNTLVHIRPMKATFDDVGMVHTADYIETIRNSGCGYIDPDTYLSEGSTEAALFAAGAVIEAVDRCRSNEIKRVFCAVRPPGHHAEPDRAMGFCIFNNIAIGARHALRAGYRRVFIADFDVHHGNGTQRIFGEDDAVFYFSTHQSPHYPGTGADSETGTGRGIGFTYNIPMPAGSGDTEYSAVYNGILPNLVERFAPDLILVSAGYDIHKDDPLSGMRVSKEGIRSIVKGILSSAGHCPSADDSRLPVVFALEGGYDQAALAESVLITIEEMLKG